MSAGELVVGYSSAVEDLRCASRGLWLGPALNPDLLSDAASAVDGTDPSALLECTHLAVGDSEDFVGTQESVSGVFHELGDFGDGLLGDCLEVLSADWGSHREAVRFIEQQTAECAAAINTIAQDSGEVLRALCEELQGMIGVLCAQLHTLDPAEHSAAFRGCIDAAGELIDRAGTFILGVCEDRDEALGLCYDQLLGMGEPIAVPGNPLVNLVEEPPAKPIPVVHAESSKPEAPVPDVPATKVPIPEPLPSDTPAPEAPAQQEPASEEPVGGASKRGGARKAGAW
ncbi:SPOR domain-containing protein [Corynebacterium freiburgense]|uniref:SPOR domain-containing protein n=1 Tax=Corynebacterium freiburgense TaxID=556548 RepID=UPI00047E8398|nr:hypothetical protein [Corynebacterium freiburgense]WJZ01718.1 hypothetical protein CFREI_02070 [Corynebacterium freiburgense]